MVKNINIGNDNENKLNNEKPEDNQGIENLQNSNNKLKENLEITPSNFNENFQEITTDRISDNEFNELLIQYPCLDDDVKVEKRNPKENKIEKRI